jgi:hypothetical protein
MNEGCIKPVPNETIVVTVTYGNRHQFVAALIEGVKQCGVGSVVIVENGCDAESLGVLEQLAKENEGLITLLLLGENRGSAGGFKAGIRYARAQTKFPYIWLLDDDNVPQPLALAELLSAYVTLKILHGSEAISLLSLRETKRWVWRVAKGESPDTVMLRRNSFCGLHVADLLNGLRRKLQRIDGALLKEPISLHFAPYGGLWIPSVVVDEIGYPDEAIFLYHDDTEYSSRISAHNAKLYLVPTSRVDDIELSWSADKTHIHGFSRAFLAGSDTQVYYTTRNKVYFETHIRNNTWLIQRLNEVVFWLLLYWFAFFYNVPRRRQLLQKAVMDGKHARLGKVRLVSDKLFQPVD